MRYAMSLLVAAALLQAGYARADECRMNARQAFQDCKDACRDQFTQQKFICRNVSPECGLACLAGRQTCRAAVHDILETGQLPGGGTLDNCATGTDGCDAALQQGRQSC